MTLLVGRCIANQTHSARQRTASPSDICVQEGGLFMGSPSRPLTYMDEQSKNIYQYAGTQEQQVQNCKFSLEQVIVSFGGQKSMIYAWVTVESRPTARKFGSTNTPKPNRHGAARPVLK